LVTKNTVKRVCAIKAELVFEDIAFIIEPMISYLKLAVI
jgi:hypothetical protein